MNIVIFAIGSRGDVQPYVALGKGLRAAGHAVRVLSTDDFGPLVTGAGLEFCSIGASTQARLQAPEWQGTAERGNLLEILPRMGEELKRIVRQLLVGILDACQGDDLMITGLGGLVGGFSVAEKLKLSVVQAYTLPLTPTGTFPGVIIPVLTLGGLLNRLSHHVMRQILWQTFRVGDQTVRQSLEMPRASFWGPFKSLHQQRVPTLYAYSTHVIPRPAEWPDFVHVTGYWFLDAPDWTPPLDLAHFLEAGPPPVYIGFGSMGSRDPEQTAELVLKALALAGQRGVLASGWGGLGKTDLPESVLMIDSAPHDWLFPRMAAVVHHGGVGTTAAGLRAGVPSILVPFMGDQPFWGQRVAALGVGPAPIARQRLTAERLAEAITAAVTDQLMRERAAELGERLRAEDGIGKAVEVIEKSSTDARSKRLRKS